MKQLEDLKKCPKCKEIMTPVYENNGFEEQPKKEFVGYKCKKCKNEE